MALHRIVSGLIIAAGAAWWSSAQATTINLNYTGTNGYTAVGNFTYAAAPAPTVITESGAGATTAVQSFTISFYDPRRNLLETGSAVINGVSSDRFFALTYNTATQNVSVLDGDVGGTTYQYFLTNLRTPTGSVVPPGQTTFNLFLRSSANAALDTAASISATVAPAPVPEPSGWALLPIASLGLLALRRRQKTAAS